MRFEVLGPLRVFDQGHPIRIGGPREQKILATLLVNVGMPVPEDRLAAAVWGEDRPATVRAQLQNGIALLRRMLRAGPGGAVAIVRSGSGFALELTGGELDSVEFDRLVADAARDTEPARAVELYRTALGLWRGPALDGIRDGPVLRGEAQSLDERHLACLESRMQLDLALGRHGELVAELAQLTDEYPARERLLEMRLLALYRTGRRQEALTVFAQVRTRFVEETGLDPGPELERLYRAILRADPELDRLPPGPGGSPDPAAPRQLPLNAPGFVGRSAELAQLDKLLNRRADGTPIIVISGPAGTGKTSLAVRWAHRVAHRFPDGQLYVNLRGFDPSGHVMGPAEALRNFLDGLGVAPRRIPPDLTAQANLYRSLLAGKRVLVVLDNARAAEQVRPLLPGSPTALVVVTSRDRLTPMVATDAAQPLPLDLFSAEESRNLLAGRLGTPRVTAERGAVDTIVQCCARLPLALVIVAARAQQPGVLLSTVATELTTTHPLDVLDAGDPMSQVRSVLSWSNAALSAPAARVFRLLGLHPGPDVSLAATASLVGQPPSEVAPLLVDLARMNLLNESAPGRYAFHDLLRAYATELTRRVDPEAERRAALRRLFDHYSHTAHAADRLLDVQRDPIPVPLVPAAAGTRPEPVADSEQAMSWMQAEHRVLLTALRQAADAGFDAQAWQLAWTFVTFLNRKGHWHDLLSSGEVAVRVADRLGIPAARASAHRQIGLSSSQTGRYADSDDHLHRALAISLDAGDAVGQAIAHRFLAILSWRKGELPNARTHAQRALTLYQAAGHRRGEAFSENAVGWYHALLGEYPQALAHCTRALGILQELGYRQGECATWDSLGYVYSHLGDLPEAARCYQRSLELYRDLGDLYRQAEVLTHLGDTLHAAADVTAARETWQQALTILTDLDHPEADVVRAKLRQVIEV